MTRLAPLALGALTLTAACDLALAPDTAEGAGVHPARIAVLLGSDVANMPTEITAVEVEVFDLRVHRSSDDTWIMLAPQPVRVDIVEPDVTPAHDGIPLRPDHYDAIELVIGGVYVGSGEMWSEARLEHDELSAAVSWPVRGRSVLDIRFDLGSALRSSMAAGWSFTPAMSATLDARP